MKVLHAITGLGQGGAEAVLYRLACASPTIQHEVVSLTGEGHYGPRLRASGIPVHALDHSRGRIGLGGLLALRRRIDEARPDVVQTWMYHANLVGGLVARCAPRRPVVWGIRHSDLTRRTLSASAHAAARICAPLSRRVPQAIVCCSAEAARAHQAIGYRAAKFAIIPNGYDLTRFAPNDEARARVRAELGVASDEVLLGMVARWHPVKDHETLLRALAQLRGLAERIRCVLVGGGMLHANRALEARIVELGLGDRVILAGPRDDVPAVMNALDVHVLSSAGEAFPNVVAEAMACGTPNVVTAAGDTAHIVGDVGWVVPPRDPGALAQAIATALRALACRDRVQLRRRCRARIEENFSLDRMVAAYVDLWGRVT
jgi:glycosyltransferase involved in cell wall biosynthesis